MVTSPKGLVPEKDNAGEGQQHIEETDSSSRQRGRPGKQDRNSQGVMGLGTKTYWLTDRQSQCDFGLIADDSERIE
jgi:hypothetical protein